MLFETRNAMNVVTLIKKKNLYRVNSKSFYIKLNSFFFYSESKPTPKISFQPRIDV